MSSGRIIFNFNPLITLIRHCLYPPFFLIQGLKRKKSPLKGRYSLNYYFFVQNFWVRSTHWTHLEKHHDIKSPGKGGGGVLSQ